MGDRHRSSPDPARFWAKVDRSGECWTWTGYRHPVKGYGQFHYEAGSNPAAHRIAYELTNGPIPAGMHVLHSCDNPPCVRPDHLRLGTNADNVVDRDTRARQARGERHGFHTLTADNVRRIRALGASGVSGAQIAKSLPVTEGTVRTILRGETWTHIDSPDCGGPRPSLLPGVG